MILNCQITSKKKTTRLTVQVTFDIDLINTQISPHVSANTFRFLQPTLILFYFLLDFIYFSRKVRQQCYLVARGWITLHNLTCKRAQLEDKYHNCYLTLYYLSYNSVHDFMGLVTTVFLFKIYTISCSRNHNFYVFEEYIASLAQILHL